MMEGNTEKVPVVTPEYQQHFFQLGRILSHRYMLTGYFPLCLSQAFIAELVDPSTTASDAVLLQSFLHYIDDFEAQAIERRLARAESSSHMLENVVLPMLSRCNSHSLPTLSNLKEVVVRAAR